MEGKTGESHTGKLLGSFTIDHWHVQPARLSIRKTGGNEVRVKPRSMAVLAALANADGQVVAKNDLLDAVWPRAEVTEGVLSQAMLELRVAFGDDARNPSVIETIRSIGFRLIPEVRWHDPSPERDGDDLAVNHRPGRIWKLAVPVVFIVGLVAFVFNYQIRSPDDSMTQPALPYLMVVPFDDASAEGDQKFFSRGMAEEIAVQLASSDRLRLVSTQALLPHLSNGLSPIEIATRFKVDLLITGSVRRQVREVRLVVELSDVHSGEQLWMETYERPLSDVFVVQNEVARSIARTLLGQAQLSARAAPTSDLTAYDYYLRGIELVTVQNKDANEQAIALFLRALDLDPDFALARASLAEALAIRGYIYEAGDASLETALEEAGHALERSGQLAHAYYAKALALMGLARFREASDAITRAVQISPNHAAAVFIRGFVADARGNLREAVRYNRLALELNPIQSRTVVLARLMYLMGRTDLALALAQRGRRMSTTWTVLYHAHLLVLMERFDEAAELCGQVLAGGLPRSSNLCGFGALVAGDLTTAERLLREDWNRDPRARWGPFTFAASGTHLAWIELQKRQRQPEAVEGLVTVERLLAESERLTRVQLERGNDHWALSYNLAAIAAIRGSKSLAMDHLDSAYADGFRDYRLLELDPVFTTFRTQREFMALIEKINLEFELLDRDINQS